MALYLAKLSSYPKGEATQKYDYIMRNKSYGKNHNDLAATGMLNIPDWADTARDFFAAADRFERSNGVAIKQIIIGLPCELSLEANIKIAEDIAKRMLDYTKAGCWAIHNKPAVTKNVANIHMHLIFNDRIMDDYFTVKPPELFFKRYNPKKPKLGGYKKDDRFASVGQKAKININWMRSQIEEAINNGYEKAGLNIKVSCKSLKDQYNDAIKNGDTELAEKLNREPIQFLGIKNWKKIYPILKANNAIDLSQPIPLMITEANYKVHQQLLSDNPKVYSKLLDLLDNQNTKLKLEYQWFLKEEERLLSNIDVQASYISGSEYKNLLNGQLLKLKRQIHQNNQYDTLYENIFKNAETISTVINNVITRGRLRRYYKAKQAINQADQEMQTLKTANKVTPDIQKKYDWIILLNTTLAKKLENEILQINQKTNTPIRFNTLTNRLKKSFAKAGKKYKSNLEVNKEYQNIINQINTTIQNIPQEISLPLNQAAIRIYQAKMSKNIKKIPVILNALNQYLQTNKPKQIQKKENQKTRDDYSR